MSRSEAAVRPPAISTSATGRRRRRSGLGPGALALVLYTAGGIALLRSVWLSPHPAGLLGGELGDPPQGLWFLAWIPHALGAATNPFFSGAMFAPHGINLAANVGTPLLGIVFWPLTAAAGPVISYDVALTLAPVLTAFSTYLVLNRYLERRLATFTGGALAGWSAGLTTEMTQGHLQVTMLALLPVVAALLYESLALQRHPPVRLGALLGLAAGLQGLVGLEPLLLLAVPVTVVLALSAAWMFARGQLAGRLRPAALSLATATVVATGILAYPLWFAFAGPQHLPGAIPVPRVGSPLESLVVPFRGLPAAVAGEVNGYLGAGVVVLCLAGLVTLWKDRFVRLLAALGAVSVLFELGDHLRLVGSQTTSGIPLPSVLLDHLPLSSEVWPLRFSLVTALFAAALSAASLDRLGERLAASHGRRAAGLLPPLAGFLALSLAILACPDPLPVESVAMPAGLAARLGSLPPGTTVLDEPPISNFSTVPLVWQTEDGFRYRLADGYGYLPAVAGLGGGAPLLAAGDAWVLSGGPVATLARPFGSADEPALRRQLARLGIGAVVVSAGALPGGRLAALEHELVRALGPGATSTSSGGDVVVARQPARAGGPTG